jgi:hypothetical protein
MNDDKLHVLAGIAGKLNEAGVHYALGGSLLLYFYGLTDIFHDIDLMVSLEDAEKAKEALLSLGQLQSPNPKAVYKTKAFYEFTVSGVDIDVMAGFIIVRNGREYDCSLLPDPHRAFLTVGGQKVYLDSLADWRRYYFLMGREEKVRMIDQGLAAGRGRELRKIS